jgi:hypothetical protein
MTARREGLLFNMPHFQDERGRRKREGMLRN